ncbi:hypothetical protein LCGC14_2535830 [marine sediment metagenome]|uniref:Uncharacterized protein n=1 Tax=marine sediment metagenome TaxID=412755 RepID=A0A0F9BF36_9ZZZZ
MKLNQYDYDVLEEKARKWDETLAHGLFETGHVTLKDYTNALKLWELIEKYRNHPDSNISSFCKELLQESKK